MADAVVFPEPGVVFPPEAGTTAFPEPEVAFPPEADAAAEVGSADASSTDFEVTDTVLVDAATDLADAVVFPEPGVVFPPEVAILLVFADFFAVVIDAS